MSELRAESKQSSTALVDLLKPMWEKYIEKNAGVISPAVVPDYRKLVDALEKIQKAYDENPRGFELLEAPVKEFREAVYQVRDKQKVEHAEQSGQAFQNFLLAVVAKFMPRLVDDFQDQQIHKPEQQAPKRERRNSWWRWEWLFGAKKEVEQKPSTSIPNIYIVIHLRNILSDQANQAKILAAVRAELAKRDKAQAEKDRLLKEGVRKRIKLVEEKAREAARKEMQEELAQNQHETTDSKAMALPLRRSPRLHSGLQDPTKQSTSSSKPPPAPPLLPASAPPIASDLNNELQSKKRKRESGIGAMPDLAAQLNIGRRELRSTRSNTQTDAQPKDFLAEITRGVQLRSATDRPETKVPASQPPGGFDPSQILSVKLARTNNKRTPGRGSLASRRRTPPSSALQPQVVNPAEMMQIKLKKTVCTQPIFRGGRQQPELTPWQQEAKARKNKKVRNGEKTNKRQRVADRRDDESSQTSVRTSVGFGYGRKGNPGTSSKTTRQSTQATAMPMEQ
jgi:hypothetical protein